MKRQAIYFIETKEGERLYKLDTFWSKGEIKDAKVHYDTEDDKERFFKSLCYGFKPFVDNDKLKIRAIKSKYNGSKYGYQIVLTDQNIDYISELDNLEVSKPFYLKLIQEISDDSTVKSIDYVPYDRDKKIDDILK